MSILDQICEFKKKEIAKKKRRLPLDELTNKLQEKPKTPKLSFYESLIKNKSDGRPSFIAEIKKASPSAGLIRPDFEPVSIARSYFENGASCLSVLTDSRYFQGQDSFIADIKAQIALPVLRKDFIIDPYQIYESSYLGADCILLIMAALDDQKLEELYETAQQTGLDVLIETHDENEMKRAKALNPQLLGVNSRDLKAQKTNFTNFEKLASLLPENTINIAESGIKSSEDIAYLLKIGYDGFLIGEHFMRQKDPGKALKQIRTCIQM